MVFPLPPHELGRLQSTVAACRAQPVCEHPGAALACSGHGARPRHALAAWHRGVHPHVAAHAACFGLKLHGGVPRLAGSRLHHTAPKPELVFAQYVGLFRPTAKHSKAQAQRGGGAFCRCRVGRALGVATQPRGDAHRPSGAQPRLAGFARTGVLAVSARGQTHGAQPRQRIFSV